MTVDFPGTGMNNSICACSVAGSTGTNVQVDCLPGKAVLIGAAIASIAGAIGISGAMRWIESIGMPANAAVGAGEATLTQEGFRWRNDNGDEDEATWYADQDANASVAVQTPIRLRVLMDALNDPDTGLFRLEYRKDGDTEWLVVE